MENEPVLYAIDGQVVCRLSLRDLFAVVLATQVHAYQTVFQGQVPLVVDSVWRMADALAKGRPGEIKT